MNITLIGMPGCGKSTAGLYLARQTGMHFVDVDKVIMRETGKTLSQIIDSEGDDGFRAVEGRIAASLQASNSVIAPGGSVVYSDQAMEHLRSISTVVYLWVSQEQLLRRLGNLHDRGVTMRPGETFAELYAEREPLYRRWAHIRIDADTTSLFQVTRMIRKSVKL